MDKIIKLSNKSKEEIYKCIEDIYMQEKGLDSNYDAINDLTREISKLEFKLENEQKATRIQSNSIIKYRNLFSKANRDIEYLVNSFNKGKSKEKKLSLDDFKLIF